MKRPCSCPFPLAAIVAAVLFFSFSATRAEAVDIYVPTDYALIQDAINQAISGDTVWVEPGTYQELLSMKDGVFLFGIETARTFLDGNGGGPIITASGAVTGAISNFTFIRASVGIQVSSNSGSIEITNNVFEVGPTGTGIAVQNATGTVIVNNTFYSNGTAISRDADLPIINNIFASNQTAINDTSALEAQTAYNIFSSNTTTGPVGSNSANCLPLFVKPTNHDFHLQEDPLNCCIDAGDQTIGDGTDIIDGTPIDIGAYGGQFADPFPFPVSGLSVVSTATTSIVLSWLPNLSYLVTNTTNTGSYNLYYGYAPGDYNGTDANGGLSPSPISVGTNTTFTLANLGPSAPVLGQPVPGDSQLVLSWTAVVNAAGYKVHYGQTSTDENTLDVLNVTSYRLTGLTNGQPYSVALSAYAAATYYISVTAVDSTAAAHESAFSSEVSAQLSQPLESGLSNALISVPDATAGYPALKGTSNGCFIATAAYGSYSAPEVLALRSLRDRYLLTTAPGRRFVRVYYHYSPAAAALLNAHPAFKPMVRTALMPAVGAAIFLTETSLLVKMAVLLAGCAVALALLSRRRGQVHR
jgi:hypothetical protein